MKSIFADSFFFFALLNDSDRAHARAVRFIDTLNRPLLTTAWVLAEVADGLCARRQRRKVAGLLDFLHGHERVTVLPAGQGQFDAGVALYRKREDKDWSLTDCISFSVMREHGMTDALTGDRHFEQAGVCGAAQVNLWERDSGAADSRRLTRKKGANLQRTIVSSAAPTPAGPRLLPAP